MRKVFRLTNLVYFTALLFFLIVVYTHNAWYGELSRSPDRGYCPPKNNIAFLKTHKTAGTTVQNIFFRFADKYDRVVAIPFLLQHLGYIQKFHKDSVFKLKDKYQNHVFAHHAIFDYRAMREALPEDAAFVTVLRDPVAQFESAYSYFNFKALYRKNITALSELKTTDAAWLKVKDDRKKKLYGRNQQAFDLGVDPVLFDDEGAILEKVEELDAQFDLVMITELLDESVILLKDKLCWDDVSDVITFKNYARTAHYKVELTSEQKRSLRAMNMADQIIYDHFRRKLLRQIDEFGKERMEREVTQLRVLTKQMSEFCMEEEEEPEVEGRSKKVKKFVSFKLKKEAEEHKVCRDLTKGDWPYTLDLIDKQRALYDGSDVQINGLVTVFKERLALPH